MNRWKAALIILMGLGLVGCSLLEPPDPYPYSFTNCEKNPYPRTNAGARRFIYDALDLWTYEEDVPNGGYWGELCQAPIISARRMKGDCDDFAVMIAYYLQEYWGYDTFITILDAGSTDHAVAFVEDAALGIEMCGGCPYLVDTYYNVDYRPVDLPSQGGLCPVWDWYVYDRVKFWLHDQFSGAIEWTSVLEWEELVNEPLSE